MDTPSSCLLSPGPSGTLALAHTHTLPQARGMVLGALWFAAVTLAAVFGRVLEFLGGELAWLILLELFFSFFVRLAVVCFFFN